MVGGSWFYAENLEKIKPVVDGFDREEAESIAEVQDLCEKNSLKANLAFIQTHLSFLPASIKQVEEAGLTL